MTRHRLVAGATASGAVLWLTLSANGHSLEQQSVSVPSEERILPQRVDDLRKKLRAELPELGSGKGSGAVQNIVQFFNFLNCSRPGWRNC
jgi:hypothetical protein